jgi:glycosyltransferase involved in cell wall biosynthesis
MLNDNSGSPNILSLVIKGLIEKNYQADLFTSSASGGFLGGIKGLKYHRIYFRFTENKLITGILFLIVQIRYFFSVFPHAGKKNVDVYINTILPFGAALSAKLLNKRIIYHIHEYPVKRNLFTRIGIFVFLRCADKAIFVSDYLFHKYQINNNRKILVYNALSPEFVLKARSYHRIHRDPVNILMACSLKKYKGVDIFLALAERMPQYNFTLLLNSDDVTYKKFINNTILSDNMVVYPNIGNLHPYYEQADLLLNLSLPEMWIETFGLTVLEALTYGIPVIVPPTGGVIELVKDGYNGFMVDPADQRKLTDTISRILSDPDFYIKLAENAKLSALNFSYLKMINSIEEILLTGKNRQRID